MSAACQAKRRRMCWHGCARWWAIHRLKLRWLLERSCRPRPPVLAPAPPIAPSSGPSGTFTRVRPRSCRSCRAEPRTAVFCAPAACLSTESRSFCGTAAKAASTATMSAFPSKIWQTARSCCGRWSWKRPETIRSVGSKPVPWRLPDVPGAEFGLIEGVGAPLSGRKLALYRDQQVGLDAQSVVRCRQGEIPVRHIRNHDIEDERAGRYQAGKQDVYLDAADLNHRPRFRKCPALANGPARHCDVSRAEPVAGDIDRLAWLDRRAEPWKQSRRPEDAVVGKVPSVHIMKPAGDELKE